MGRFLGRAALAVVAALAGAGGFHAYYLGLDSDGRCGVDHVLDGSARAACARMAAAAADYTSADRAKLDALVSEIAD